MEEMNTNSTNINTDGTQSNDLGSTNTNIQGNQPQGQPTAQQQYQQGFQQGQPTQQGQVSEPAQYDFSAVVGADALDDKIAGEFSDVLRNANVAPDKANDLVKFGLDYAQNVAQEVYTQIQQQQEQQSQAWAQQAQQELGAQFNETVARAGTAIEYLEKQVPELRDILNTNGLGNRVEVIKMFAAMGDALGEDRGHGYGGGAGQNDIAHIMYPNMK